LARSRLAPSAIPSWRGTSAASVHDLAGVVTQQAYAFIGLTAIVAGLIGLLVFAALRFMAAARDSRRHRRESGMENTLLTAALDEAIGRLKAQERAMAARAEASERLSGQIVASLAAGLIVTDLEGNVRIVNPSSRRLLGLGDRPMSGTARDVLGADSPLAMAIDECSKEGVPIVRRSLELRDPRTPVTHLGVTVSPLVDENGSAGGVICLFTDLSKVVDLEEQLRLKDTLARLGELTAGLAHEFRNGLATIHGYARIIDLESLPPTQRTYVEGLRQETDALGQIVTNFLNFARPTQLTLAPVDLRQIAERVADEIRGEVERRQGTVSVSGTWAVVDGDEVLLRQAFSNLARNALEACAGASVAPDIRLDATRDDRARVVHVRVSDNGPGIDAALRERVFRPFFTTKREGTGLGLALVLKIVVTHNGRVRVVDQPKMGTTMDVVLPLPPAA
jgi:signal transduction histidine kinase